MDAELVTSISTAGVALISAVGGLAGLVFRYRSKIAQIRNIMSIYEIADADGKISKDELNILMMLLRSISTTKFNFKQES